MNIYNYKNYTIHHFNKLESTNKTAFEMAKIGKISHNEIILADEQTLGKGRKNRNWVSPKGNLYFSLLLKPKMELDKISLLSFLAIVVLNNIFKNPHHKIQNKWPNDLLINEKKMCRHSNRK